MHTEEIGFMLIAVGVVALIAVAIIKASSLIIQMPRDFRY
jgi:hypothetical protein